MAGGGVGPRAPDVALAGADAHDVGLVAVNVEGKAGGGDVLVVGNGWQPVAGAVGLIDSVVFGGAADGVPTDGQRSAAAVQGNAAHCWRHRGMAGGGVGPRAPAVSVAGAHADYVGLGAVNVEGKAGSGDVLVVGNGRQPVAAVGLIDGVVLGGAVDGVPADGECGVGAGQRNAAHRGRRPRGTADGGVGPRAPAVSVAGADADDVGLAAVDVEGETGSGDVFVVRDGRQPVAGAVGLIKGVVLGGPADGVPADGQRRAAAGQRNAAHRVRRGLGQRRRRLPEKDRQGGHRQQSQQCRCHHCHARPSECALTNHPGFLHGICSHLNCTHQADYKE